MPFWRRKRASAQQIISQPKHSNGLPSIGSFAVRTLAIVAAVGLVLSSAMFGAYWAYGLGSMHGPLMAYTMASFALALEVAKPLSLAAALRSFRAWMPVRGLLLLLLALVAVLYSLAAELSLVSTSRGDLAAKREVVANSYDDKRAAITDARRELAALAPSRLPAEIQADIARLMAAAPKADCGTAIGAATYRTLCSRVAILRGEAARSERRAELQAIIAKATTAPAPAAAVGKADAGAASLSTLLASMGVDVPAAKLSDMMIVLAVLAIETGSALGGVLVEAVSGGPVGHKTGQSVASTVELKADSRTETRPARPQRALPDTKTAKKPDGDGPKRGKRAKRKPAPKRTQNRTRKLGNVIKLVQRSGGQLKGGQRALAKQLKVSKSAANELLHEAAAAGVLKVQTNRRGTSVALAS